MECNECEYYQNGVCLTPSDFHSCEKSENRKEIMRLAKQLYPLMLSEGVTHIDFYDGAVLTLKYEQNE